MKRKALNAYQYAEALKAYRSGDFERSLRLCMLNQSSPASAKLFDMSLRRLTGRGPGEPLPVVVIDDE